MTATPRSIIRRWVKADMAAGMDLTTAIQRAVERAIDDEEIVAAVMNQVVRQTAGGLTVKTHRTPSTAELREEIEQEAATLPVTSPLARFTPLIDLSMSTTDIARRLLQMTRYEVESLAIHFAGEAERNETFAGMCQAIANGLQDGQKVGDVFSVRELLSLRANMTTVSTTRVFAGKSLIATVNRTTQ